MLRRLLCLIGAISLLVRTGSAASCDIRLWVRADDLHAGSLTEGDARLVNNLTSAGHEDCRIASWTLGLRHRERAALKYPLRHAKLPAKPTYNSRPRVQQPAGLVETFIDAREEEERKYHRKLEDYANAMRDSEKWAIIDEERILFDITADMGSVENESAGFQVVEGAPFTVIVPPVVLPYKVQHAGNRYQETKTNVFYTHEFDLGYYGLVRLVNGTEIEVPGGETAFVPPPSEGSSTERTETLVFNATAKPKQDQDPVGFVISKGAVGGDQYLSEAKFDDLAVNVTLQGIPELVQGRDHKIHGSISKGNDEFEVQWVDVKLRMRMGYPWVSDHLLSVGRGELETTLAAISSAPRFPPFRQEWPTLVTPAAKYVSEAMNTNTSCCLSRDFARRRHRFSPGVPNIDEAGGFAVWVNVSDLDPPTNLPSAYEVAKAELVVKLAVSPRSVQDIKQNETGDGCEGERSPGAQTRSEAIHAITKQSWSSQPWSGCRLWQNRTAPSTTPRPVPRVTNLELVIADVDIHPRRWKRLERTPLQQVTCDESLLRPFTSPEARAPSLIAGKPREENRRRACQDADSLELLSSLTKTRSLRNNIDDQRNASLEFVRARYNLVLGPVADLMRLPRPGSASVGKLWAHTVIMPLLKQRG